MKWHSGLRKIWKSLTPSTRSFPCRQFLRNEVTSRLLDMRAATLVANLPRTNDSHPTPARITDQPKSTSALTEPNQVSTEPK